MGRARLSALGARSPHCPLLFSKSALLLRPGSQCCSLVRPASPDSSFPPSAAAANVLTVGWGLRETMADAELNGFLDSASLEDLLDRRHYTPPTGVVARYLTAAAQRGTSAGCRQRQAPVASVVGALFSKVRHPGCSLKPSKCLVMLYMKFVLPPAANMMSIHASAGQ